VFAIAFTAPTWKNGLVLLFGAILTPGRRTVTSALRVMGLEDDPRFEKYHRVLNRNRWQPLLLSKLLLGLIIGLRVPAGMPLLLAVDETLERRWGPKINYLGVFRDPVRSTKKKVVYASGVRWLTMALVIPVPWAKRQWALPFLSVALLSPKTSAKLGKRHRTSVARAGRLLSQVRRWHPEREIVVVGDGAFATVPLIQHCQRKHIQVTLVSRLRLDARRASKRVGGGLKKVVKRAIDPSEAEVEEAIEAILTPTHADTLETLLNEPFAGALHKARTDRNAQV